MWLAVKVLAWNPATVMDSGNTTFRDSNTVAVFNRSSILYFDTMVRI